MLVNTSPRLLSLFTYKQFWPNVAIITLIWAENDIELRLVILVNLAQIVFGDV